MLSLPIVKKSICSLEHVWGVFLRIFFVFIFFLRISLEVIDADWADSAHDVRAESESIYTA